MKSECLNHLRPSPLTFSEYEHPKIDKNTLMLNSKTD